MPGRPLTTAELGALVVFIAAQAAAR